MKGKSKTGYVILLKFCLKKSPEFFSLQGEKRIIETLMENKGLQKGKYFQNVPEL